MNYTRSSIWIKSIKKIVPASHKPKILHFSWWLWQCTSPFSSILRIEYLYIAHTHPLIYPFTLSTRPLQPFSPWFHLQLLNVLSKLYWIWCTHAFYDVCVLPTEYTLFGPKSIYSHYTSIFIFIFDICVWRHIPTTSCSNQNMSAWQRRIEF